MLIRIGARGGVFGEGLKHIQVPLGGVPLVETALDHGELVVAGSSVPADLEVASQKRGGFFEFLVRDA